MTEHQIIKTPGGEELVLLSRAEYDALIQAAEEAAEDLADLTIYDHRKADLEGSEPLPIEVSSAILKGVSILKAYRTHRGMNQTELAQATGLTQGFLSDLENGRRKMTAATAKKLAAVLNVNVRALLG